MTPCSKCRETVEVEGQRYCRKCRAAYARDYRRVERRLIMERTRRAIAEAFDLVGDWAAADNVRSMRLE